MLRKTKCIFSISWPIDSAATSTNTSTTSSKTKTTKTPMTRAKARWLLYRGGIGGSVAITNKNSAIIGNDDDLGDIDVARCAIQTSTTWQAACTAVAAVANNVTKTNNNNNINSNISHHHNMLPSSSELATDTVVSPLVVESLSLRLLQEINFSDVVFRGSHRDMDNIHRLQITEALNAAAAEEVDLQPSSSWIPSSETENEPSVGEEGDFSKNNNNFDENNNNDEDDETVRDKPFTVELASQHNVGTLSRHASTQVCEKVLDFCSNNKIVITPSLVSNLSLLPLEWHSALSLVKRCDKLYDSGSPLPVLVGAMRSCSEKGTRWSEALSLYQIASERFFSQKVDSNAVSFAFQALMSMEKETAGFLNSSSSSQNNHWRCTLKLHSDIVTAAANYSVSWLLRGESGTSVTNSACISAAMSRNWELALNVLNNTMDTQFGSMVDASLIEQEKRLLIPEANTLFATVSACIAAGRHHEASRVMKLFRSYNYNVCHVSGGVLLPSLRNAHAREESLHFSFRLLQPCFSDMLKSQYRGLWTVPHCIAAALFARNSLRVQSSTMWSLAAAAFSEYSALSETSVPPVFVMQVGKALVVNSEATEALLRELKEMSVLSTLAAETSTPSNNINDDGIKTTTTTTTRSFQQTLQNNIFLRTLPLISSAFHSTIGRWKKALRLTNVFFEESEIVERRRRKNLFAAPKPKQNEKKVENNDNINNNLEKSKEAKKQILERKDLATAEIQFRKTLLQTILFNYQSMRRHRASWSVGFNLYQKIQKHDSSLIRQFPAIPRSLLYCAFLSRSIYNISSSDSSSSVEENNNNNNDNSETRKAFDSEEKNLINSNINSSNKDLLGKNKNENQDFIKQVHAATEESRSFADPSKVWKVALALYHLQHQHQHSSSSSSVTPETDQIRQKMARYLLHVHSPGIVEALLSGRKTFISSASSSSSSSSGSRSGSENKQQDEKNKINKNQQQQQQTSSKKMIKARSRPTSFDKMF